MFCAAMEYLKAAIHFEIGVKSPRYRLQTYWLGWYFSVDGMN